ncbi:putative carbohydrate esterase [Russula earlei]|uniref:Carbohydrate esterase n=1 Tax=Russula earlei TaxID=71964 RepID=A0ACC0U658_9AGAM|nr:putative carbohydrate esterase [Russula earlei]
MKHLLLLVLVSLASFNAMSQNRGGVDPDFHIYLLAGQSNMAGRAPVDTESKVINPQIFMLDKDNHWVPATDPVHFDKPDVAGVGPAIAFAKAMIGNNQKIKIGLVPCALGGSPIRVWEPDSVYLKVFHPYDDAISRTKLAMQKGVLKGILWHQGESDNNPKGAAVYMDKLKALINRFRTDLQQPTLPFVAGEIGYFGKGKPVINAVINQLPAHVPYTAVVSAEGLTDKGDQTHFDTRSARELGRRYAEAMKEVSRR